METMPFFTMGISCSTLLQGLHTADKCAGSTPLSRALAYCAAVSVSFVGSLYLLVPSSVRKLDRNDARQIRWRTLSTSIVCAGALFALPYFIESDSSSSIHGLFTVILESQNPSECIKALWDFSVRTGKQTSLILLHTSILYLGPILQNLLQVHIYLSDGVSKDGKSYTLKEFFSTLYKVYVADKVNLFAAFESDKSRTNERWVLLRNLLIAPLSEEIAFRACISTMLSCCSTLTTKQVALISPLFFGTAHAHHSFLLYQRGIALPRIALQTAFQLTYTSVFGSYVSYMYLMSGSVIVVSTCHSFCNAMGLPDMSFLRPNSPLYRYRKSLLTAHVAGLVAFVVTI